MKAPVLLTSAHQCVHETPCTRSDYDAVLGAVVVSALAHQGDDGSLELDPCREDVGDTSLGVTSLLALAWQRQILDGDTAIAIQKATRRSLDFFLQHRVFRHDNPQYPFYRIRDSGLPYARYMIADGQHPFGDWPSTVWALLQSVNVLRLGAGVATVEQLDELLAVAEGYWTWLTEATFFNSQDTANQALGAVVGALMLATEVEQRGRAADADVLRDSAVRHYQVLRAQRPADRGALIPREHGGGWDGNYAPISLSFLAQAHRVSGDPVFAEDGCDLARYLDTRLSARGFDLGGPRYSEQHAGFEGVLGLRYFSRRIDADLGRYLGDLRNPYLMDAAERGDGTSQPSGHFAFMTVWAMEDETDWFTTPQAYNRRFGLRRGSVSVAFDDLLTPQLVDVAEVAVIPSVADRQHGICPMYRDGTGPHLLTRPLGPVRTRELTRDRASAKLVNKPVATWFKELVTTQTLYLTDGEDLHIVAFLDAARLPPGSQLSLLAGLPYATPAVVPHRYAKICDLTTGEGDRFSLGTRGGRLTTPDVVHAGALSLAGNGPLRVSNPELPPGLDRFAFNSPATLRLTQEQAAFTIAADPRGYGNPDQAWSQIIATNLIEVLDGQEVPGGEPGSRWVALVATYAPAATARPRATPWIERVSAGITVTLPGITAIVGPPRGDEHGEPLLTLF